MEESAALTTPIQWMQQHRTSDTDFEKFLMMQTPISWPASTAYPPPYHAASNAQPSASIWPVDDTTCQHDINGMSLEPYEHSAGASSYKSLGAPTLDMPPWSTASEHTSMYTGVLKQHQEAPMASQESGNSIQKNLSHPVEQLSPETYMHQGAGSSLDNSAADISGIPSWSTDLQHPDTILSTLQQAQNSEVQIQHGPPTKQTPSCVRCWVKHLECDTKTDGTCSPCSVANYHPHLRIRVVRRLADRAVFGKWQDVMYRHRYSWESLAISPNSFEWTVLCHFRDGPSLPLEVVKFRPEAGNEHLLFCKSARGGLSILRKPYTTGGQGTLVLQVYVKKHLDYFLKQSSYGPWLSRVLSEANSLDSDPTVAQALRLWAAHQLLMKGWGLYTSGSLGMSEVMDSSSSLYGTVPVPPVLRLQLDRVFEQYCAITEEDCVEGLHRLLRVGRSEMPIYVVVALLLHIRERDLKDLLSWIHRRNPERQWRHQLSVKAVIQNSVHATNVLLSHVYPLGGVPENLQISSNMISTRPGSAFRKYDLRDPSSLDHLLCRRIFAQDREAINALVCLEEFGY